MKKEKHLNVQSSEPREGVVVCILDDGFLINEVETGRDQKIVPDKGTVFEEYTFSGGKNYPTKRKIVREEFKEGDKVSIFLKMEGDNVSVVAMNRMVDVDLSGEVKENLQEDLLLSRFSDLGLDYIELLSLMKGIKPLIFDKIKNVCLYFKNEKQERKVSTIKKFITYKVNGSNNEASEINRIEIYPDLIDSYISNPEKIIKEGNFLLSFFLPLSTFNREMYGKKIEKLINILTSKGFTFKTERIPPCFYVEDKLIHSEYENYSPAFWDENFIVYLPNFTNEDSNDNCFLRDECKNCSFRENKKCKGIFYYYPGFVMGEYIKGWINEKINKKGFINLLDCGCGFSPDFLDFYKKSISNLRKIYLLDPDKGSIKASERYIKNHDNFSFLNKSAEEMEFKQNYFDIITMNSSYHHIEDLNFVMKKIKKIIKDDGFFIVSDRKEEKDIGLHVRNHNLGEAINNFKNFGFNVVDSSSSKNKEIWIIKALKAGK